MTDRLSEIKIKHKHCSSIHYNDLIVPNGCDPSAIFDMRWLIEQVEKLQKENEELQFRLLNPQTFTVGSSSVYDMNFKEK